MGVRARSPQPSVKNASSNYNLVLVVVAGIGLGMAVGVGIGVHLSSSVEAGLPIAHDGETSFESILSSAPAMPTLHQASSVDHPSAHPVIPASVPHRHAHRI